MNSELYLKSYGYRKFSNVSIILVSKIVSNFYLVVTKKSINTWGSVLGIEQFKKYPRSLQNHIDPLKPNLPVYDLFSPQTKSIGFRGLWPSESYTCWPLLLPIL